ncbi:MAG: hypothetical protein IPL65_06345 [Lewinellaceae bacterium]|nr:hypothetical protein [Lewinellaceae bacterium]
MRFKLQILASAAFFLLTGTVHAQWNVVRETEQMMSFGSRPCFQVEFQNTSDNTVLEVWKDFVSKNFDAKIKKDRKTKEWVATDVKASYLNSGGVTIYATIEEDGKNAVLNAWFDIGQPHFLNSRDNAREAREVADAMRLFYYDVRRAVIGEEQKAAEKELTNVENNLKKLQKENDSLHKAIDDYNAKIKKAEQDILDNTKQQEAAIIDIDNQKKNIEGIQNRLKNVENEKN